MARTVRAGGLGRLVVAGGRLAERGRPAGEDVQRVRRCGAGLGGEGVEGQPWVGGEFHRFIGQFDGADGGVMNLLGSGTVLAHMVCCLGVQECLDGALMVHGAVALGNLVERQVQVEHPAGSISRLHTRPMSSGRKRRTGAGPPRKPTWE